ncbi:B3/4 domain-containing protein [Streptomyces griseofuscus]|uniref:B3/B4 domain-containing protein n=1 Tax=Streptomyces griseofuscus TaxID=146922 RepID=UPI003677922B
MHEVTMTETMSISPELAHPAPELALGVLTYRPRVTPTDEVLRNRIDEEVQRVRMQLEPSELVILPQVAALREAYRALGREPSRYRGSAEALLRRVLSGKGLHEVNNVVDVNNLISLHTGAAVGTYDLDRIQGSIDFGVAGPDDTYRAIGKGPLRLEGLPIFRDESGPFGGPTSDSERTMIRASTARAMTVIISFAGDGGLDGALRFAAKSLETYSGAHSISTRVVCGAETR